jgi:hypothetical protein
VSTGLTGVSTEPAVASEISTGLGTPEATPAVAPVPPSEVSTGIVPEPTVTPAEVTTGITAQPTATPVAGQPASDDWAPSPGEVALVAGMILGLTAAGFAVRTHRRRPATP